jgi:ADP-heptose:LPS heptosyltransferase
MGSCKIITKNELERIRKILIIQYKPFGDILLNTGYLPFLRNKFPKAQIDFLIQKPYKTILEDNPNIDNLILMKKKKKEGIHHLSYFWERIRIIQLVRSTKYDVIIDQFRNPGSAIISLFSGAKYRIGWKNKRWEWVYNYKVERDNLRYYSRAKFDLLNPLGLKEKPHNTYYKVKNSSQKKIDKWLNEKGLLKKRIIVFSPGTPVLAKQWDLDNYAKLGDILLENNDKELVLLWGPGERKDVEYIYKKMSKKPIIALPTTFNEAAALIKRTYVYISNDGGINHLAVAMGTPTITIFGPKTNPKKWAAWHKPIHKYVRNWDFKKPDYRRTSDKTFQITPQMVYEKFLALQQILENGKRDRQRK